MVAGQAQRYIYRCGNCGGKVSKPKVFTPKDDKGKLKRVGLHGWKCEHGCKPVKVQREIARKD